MEGTKHQRIEILQLVNDVEPALCAMIEVDGVIWGAVNARMPDRAAAHIRHHAEVGIDGLQVCAVDCPG